MCGISGYIGSKDAPEMVLEGLRALEYRGYDSVGMSAIADNRLLCIKVEGKLVNLEDQVADLPEASSAIGHTRWATHGKPTKANAHPHISDGISIVHNGIIENYEELKTELQDYVFKSDTDSEVIAHYLHMLRQTHDMVDALTYLVAKLEGAFAIAIQDLSHPNEIFLVKKASPLVIGVSKDGIHFASSTSAFPSDVYEVHFMQDKTIACIAKDNIRLSTFRGRVIEADFKDIEIEVGIRSKDNYDHYMLKEIYEQPKILTRNINRFIRNNQLNYRSEINLQGIYGLGTGSFNMKWVKNIIILGCGTALHAGMVAQYFFEDIPTSAELASEFKYRKRSFPKGTLIIAISQSGETADTLAAVEHAKQKGCRILAVCNTKESTLTRLANAIVYIEAGEEIGVAATKSFTAQILCLYMIYLALDPLCDYKEKLSALSDLPSQVQEILDQAENIKQVAEKYADYSSHMFIGRGINYPIALEGALKLKEISYIHAEGQAAGELKHGSIALIDSEMPIVAIMPEDESFQKTISNVKECMARDGMIIAVGNREDHLPAVHSFISCPQTDNPAVQAILTTIPTQLYAYYIALKKGTDIDQPRNLAKSVTVE